MKIKNLKFKIRNFKAGMTYVELIVVLSIFAVMSSVVMFNYGAFQGKVDVKNLASDIALKVVQAQKAALSGQLTTHTYISNWKPSYGVYFTLAANGLADNKSFNYFADLDNSKDYGDSTCVPTDLTHECLDDITITRSDYVSAITMYYQDTTSLPLNDITIIYTRPNSGALFRSTTVFGANTSYVQITVVAPSGQSAHIKIYNSGRVEVL